MGGQYVNLFCYRMLTVLGQLQQAVSHRSIDQLVSEHRSLYNL